jgi:indole-3-glycerol phosphate synthase
MFRLWRSDYKIMNDFLQKVMEERIAAVRAAARDVPLAVLQQQAAQRTRRHSLVAGLKERAGKSARIIAEVKKASPSAGLIREVYRPADIAAEYESCGAVGVSVLTEPRHFLGSIEDLRAVRGAINLPILRKDFICDPYQIYESAANGADVVLLICAALTGDRMRALYETALSAGLETIAEAHSAEDLEGALALDQAVIGINSRNRKTLKTDLGIARELASGIPRDRLAIAESGIKTRSDVEELLALGYRGFLIGETLMKSDDIAAALRALKGR